MNKLLLLFFLFVISNSFNTVDSFTKSDIKLRNKDAEIKVLKNSKSAENWLQMHAKKEIFICIKQENPKLKDTIRGKKKETTSIANKTTLMVTKIKVSKSKMGTDLSHAKTDKAPRKAETTKPIGHKKFLANTPKTTKAAKPLTTDNKDRKIYNGPRGTKYYLDSNGEKVFVK